MEILKIKNFLDFLTEEKQKSDKSRFMEKVSKQSNGCWKYTAHKGTDDYGQFYHKGRARQGHRVAYELFKGSVPSGKVLMHTCNHRWCVNPAHLKPGSKKENNIDTAKNGHSRNQHSGPLANSPKGKGLRKVG